MKKKYTLLLATVVTAMTYGSQAGAATITVDPTAVDTIAADGKCSLREAVINANDNAPTHADCPAGDLSPTVDVIKLPAGTYNLGVVGVSENNALTGDLDIKDDVSIEGDDPATTVIDASGIVDRIFDIWATPAGAGHTLTIKNLTLRNGMATNDAGECDKRGGAICINGDASDQNRLIADQVVFEKNNGLSGGGAILGAANSEIQITRSQWIRNKADGGGAIMAYGRGLKISNNSVFQDNYAGNSGGGAIFYGGNSASEFVMMDSKVRGNQSGSSIGAIAIVGLGSANLRAVFEGVDIIGNKAVASPSGMSGGLQAFTMNSAQLRMRMRTCTIAHNEAQKHIGGLGIGAMMNSQVRAVLDDVKIAKNIAHEGLGGGLGIISTSNAKVDTVINDSWIVSNETPSPGANGDGAGIIVYGMTGGSGFANLTTKDVTIKDNQANGSGGGVFFAGQGLNMVSSKLSDNDATGGGGGLFAFHDPKVTLRDSLISNNQAKSNGGGIAFDGGPTGKLDAINTTLSGNNAGKNGGGFYHHSGDSKFSYATIANNKADIDVTGENGGGIYKEAPPSGSVTMKSTLLSGNEDLSAPQSPDIWGELNLAHYNIIGIKEGGAISGADATDQVGDSATPVPPFLDPLGLFGGFLEIHELQLASTARESSEAGPCLDLAGNVLSEDQRGVGFSRPKGAKCDIGAVEADPPAPPPPPIPAPTCTLSAPPAGGGSFNLTWTSTDSTGGLVTESTGGTTLSTALSGTQVVTPSAPSTDYVFKASNVTGTCMVTITLVPSAPPPPAPPTCSLSAAPGSGGAYTLTWSSTGATSASLTDGVPATLSTSTSGTQNVTPTGPTTYKFKATNASGNCSSSVSVTPPTESTSAPSGEGAVVPPGGGITMSPPPVGTIPAATPSSTTQDRPRSLEDGHMEGGGCSCTLCH